LALASNPNATALAIEPVLNNARAMQANLDTNHWQDRCVLVVAAAGAKLGLVPFNRGGDVPMPLAASLRDDEDKNESGRNERVLSVNIDAVAPWLAQVDLMKIDVEGHEHLVLEGARATLQQFRPTLVVECLPGSRIEAFAPLWKELGYQRFHLLPEEVRAVPRIEPTSGDPTYNYLLTVHPEILQTVPGHTSVRGG
jgi:FkbM family methyltransferase